MRESVEQVWLAGLGALALTEEEGSKFFRALVKKGEGIEKRSRARLSDTIEAARNAPSDTMAKLERQVDTTLENVMHRLGVPTRRENSSLSRRIEGLAQSMEKTPRRRRVSATRARKAAETGSTMVAACSARGMVTSAVTRLPRVRSVLTQETFLSLGRPCSVPPPFGCRRSAPARSAGARQPHRGCGPEVCPSGRARLPPRCSTAWHTSPPA